MIEFPTRATALSCRVFVSLINTSWLQWFRAWSASSLPWLHQGHMESGVLLNRNSRWVVCSLLARIFTAVLSIDVEILVLSQIAFVAVVSTPPFVSSSRRILLMTDVFDLLWLYVWCVVAMDSARFIWFIANLTIRPPRVQCQGLLLRPWLYEAFSKY